MWVKTKSNIKLLNTNNSNNSNKMSNNGKNDSIVHELNVSTDSDYYSSNDSPLLRQNSIRRPNSLNESKIMTLNGNVFGLKSNKSLCWMSRNISEYVTNHTTHNTRTSHTSHTSLEKHSRDQMQLKSDERQSTNIHKNKLNKKWLKQTNNTNNESINEKKSQTITQSMIEIENKPNILRSIQTKSDQNLSQIKSQSLVEYSAQTTSHNQTKDEAMVCPSVQTNVNQKSTETMAQSTNELNGKSVAFKSEPTIKRKTFEPMRITITNIGSTGERSGHSLVKSSQRIVKLVTQTTQTSHQIKFNCQMSAERPQLMSKTKSNVIIENEANAQYSGLISTKSFIRKAIINQNSDEENQ